MRPPDLIRRRGGPTVGDAAQGGLRARRSIPPPDASQPLPQGVSRLGLGDGRDGLVLVPANLPADRPAPLLVMLHGAGGTAEHALTLVREEAEAAGVLVLAPESRGRTWDAILRGFGPDIRFLDLALDAVFRRRAVDPARVAVGGFSDGASYALSLALGNGGLFGHALAFSPGFMAPARIVGRPHVFVSHGTGDTVLPIDPCSRRLVPALQDAGYDVLYHEFDGGHVVPPEVVRQAMRRWLDSGAG